MYFVFFCPFCKVPCWKDVSNASKNPTGEFRLWHLRSNQIPKRTDERDCSGSSGGYQTQASFKTLLAVSLQSASQTGFFAVTLDQLVPENICSWPDCSRRDRLDNTAGKYPMLDDRDSLSRESNSPYLAYGPPQPD